jgi:heptosyltransferase-3
MKDFIRQAAIIHPGAIGDCILVLPLAQYLKKTLGFHCIDLIAHSDYVRFYPGRTPVDQIRSMESLPLHRLFAPIDEFAVEEKKDSLVEAFSKYEHVISFLGAENEPFEQNLLFVIHCSHSGEVTLMPLSGPAEEHVSSFYVRQFALQNGHKLSEQPVLTSNWISSPPQDMAAGTDILRQCGIGPEDSICLIHPGSGSDGKCWALDHFRAIAELVLSQHLKPVFLLGPAEARRLSRQDMQMIKNAAPLLSDLSLEHVLAVLSCADCFLGNDSGISHLAGAMGKKTITIFGPTNPAQYKPLGPNAYVLQTTDTDFTRPSPDTQKWVQRCIEDILNGTSTQKHLTQTDKPL